MTQASVCTIGDEILIGQIVDTNSSAIASALEEIGIKVTRMVSFGDDHDEIICNLLNELKHNDIVITTGGLGRQRTTSPRPPSPRFRAAPAMSPTRDSLKRCTRFFTPEDLTYWT